MYQDHDLGLSKSRDAIDHDITVHLSTESEFMQWPYSHKDVKVKNLNSVNNAKTWQKQDSIAIAQ